MESHFSSSSASSTTTYLSQTMQPTKGLISTSNSLPYHQSSLHSVRRPSSKPWRKPAVAPLPPTPPRIYKVDPINFKDLVQSLTSGPGFLEARSLQSVAPAPIDVQRNASVLNNVLSSSSSSSPASKIISPFSAMYKDLAETLEMSSTPHHQKAHDSNVDPSYLSLNLQSPSSHHWFSFPLLSPGTMSSLEQSTVL
ncbi:hypothetical protein L3X38_034236 [Prunus dulcis]|uniref:VQ domain-containing protein n=1 Tax=Prunus dulcis TaxID=3755 RepID=A0AAD4YWN6_PRUDU|nr:hypothetical protein L3X38_034236 [Prunus dulcis]